MLSNSTFLLAVSTFFASIPVVVWLYLFFRKGEKSKKTIALVFLVGCLTAPGLLGLQYLWQIFPNFDLATFIEESIQGQNSEFIAMFLLFAALEEIFKMYVIVIIDKKTRLITTIGDAVRYSIASALAFSFIENIYYLSQFWQLIGLKQILGMYIFRSVFTACAHMIFSGVFGYFYGIGKYSFYITAQEKLSGKKRRFTKFLSKIFRIPLSHGYQQQMVVKGLLIAILMHSIFNYMLQFNILIPVILFVVCGYFYLRYLLKRKAGHLLLDIDISEKQKSTLAKKDSEVVIELLGMWFKEKRYLDVISVCERLLERDPANNIVKLFKAKASDKLENKNMYKSLFGKESKKDIKQINKNVLTKHLQEKEMLKKVKEMVKKQAAKEGKKFIDPEKTKAEKLKKLQEKDNKKYKDILDKYTGEGEFKIDK